MFNPKTQHLLAKEIREIYMQRDATKEKSHETLAEHCKKVNTKKYRLLWKYPKMYWPNNVA